MIDFSGSDIEKAGIPCFMKNISEMKKLENFGFSVIESGITDQEI